LFFFSSSLATKGDKNGLKKEIENLQNKIKDSQQGNSFSEDELEQYEKVKEEISKLEQKQEKQELPFLKESDSFLS
jgi:hypothetical protein